MSNHVRVITNANPRNRRGQLAWLFFIDDVEPRGAKEKPPSRLDCEFEIPLNRLERGKTLIRSVYYQEFGLEVKL